MRRKHESWRQSARGVLDHVIVLDQFARSMFRDTPRMLAADEQALRATLPAMEQGLDRALRTHERVFLCMPTTHSKQVAVQEQCVELFTALRDELAATARGAVQRNLE